jgi:predicted SAM-dependent methyltransferase
MQRHLQENDPRPDFLAVEKFCRGLGVDLGCGSNRLAPTVLTIDWYPHDDTDLIWNCWHEDKWNPYPFRDGRFDFVFASHILEDFPPHQIQAVFNEWLRILKPGGYLIILVPDMENSRYPDWDEVFSEEDEEVKSGKRQIGETKGNPSHRLTMGMTCLNKMAAQHSDIEVVQADTFSHDQMTLDYIIQKRK